MRWIAFGQDAVGVIAVGQQATGIVAIGQLATGVVAIGQLSRGVIVVGQLAIGVVTAGQLAIGLLWAAGMVAIAPFAGVAIGLGLFGRVHPNRWRRRRPDAVRLAAIRLPWGLVWRLVGLAGIVVAVSSIALWPLWHEMVREGGIFVERPTPRILR